MDHSLIGQACSEIALLVILFGPVVWMCRKDKMYK